MFKPPTVPDVSPTHASDDAGVVHVPSPGAFTESLESETAASASPPAGDANLHTMTDAELLTADCLDLVAGSPFGLAPERAGALLAQIGAGTSWTLRPFVGQANVKMIPEDRTVAITFSALLGLWATARAFFVIATAAELKKVIKTGAALPSFPGSPVHEALELVKAAEGILGRNFRKPWPADLPVPKWDAAPLVDAPEAEANNLFLAAVGWICLHEIAHWHLSHEPTTAADLMRQNEHDADCWATRWVLEQVPGDLSREFRFLAVVVALTWVALKDRRTRTQGTHPDAFDRLERCARRFSGDELSPALELAAYALKVCFIPGEPLECETPQEAFHAILMLAGRAIRA